MSAALSTTTTTTSARLAPQPGELIDRSRLLEFRWNGKTPHRALRGHDRPALAAAGSGCCPAATSTTGRAGNPDRGLPRPGLQLPGR
ncbi:hypothetical protein HBB16_15350 [Pseudonocardia sp. MCCB 268]|nr:hypothetical protein [Pseudonocardia cytotoxica]